MKHSVPFDNYLKNNSTKSKLKGYQEVRGEGLEGFKGKGELECKKRETGVFNHSRLRGKGRVGRLGGIRRCKSD